MKYDGNGEYVKVHFTYDEEGMIGGESMWAKPTDEALQVELANIPCFGDGSYAMGDIVEIELQWDDDGNSLMPEVISLVRSGGQETVVACFDEKFDEKEIRNTVDAALSKFDAKCEHMIGPVWAFSVAIGKGDDLFDYLVDSGYIRTDAYEQEPA